MLISHLFKSDSAHIKTAEVATGFNRSDAVATANITAQGGAASFSAVELYTTMPANLKDPSAISAWETIAGPSNLIEHSGALPSSNPSTGWQFSWILSASGKAALEEDFLTSGSSSSSTAYIRYKMLTESATTYIWASLTYTLTPATGVTFQHTWL